MMFAFHGWDYFFRKNFLPPRLPHLIQLSLDILDVGLDAGDVSFQAFENLVGVSGVDVGELDAMVPCCRAAFYPCTVTADLEVYTKKADEQSTGGKYQQVYELPKFLYVHNSRFRFIFQKSVYSA